jgi:hypothetical protein
MGGKGFRGFLDLREILAKCLVAVEKIAIIGHQTTHFANIGLQSSNS